MRTSWRWAIATACVGALVAAGCGRDGAGDDPGGSIRVLAAASLTDAFGDLAGGFEDAHPGTDVELAFDGSSSLRDQILAGAPADVFASADTATMDPVADAGLLSGEPRTFATNELEIVVPAGNPGHVDGLDDLGDEARLIGLCAAGVPCGDLARDVLSAAGVTPAPDTEEPDVRSLLDKVVSGDLDAGLVYRTDVLAAGDAVEGIEIPGGENAVTEYPIGALATAHGDTAQAFVDFVLSDQGREILGGHGFGPP